MCFLQIFFSMHQENTAQPGGDGHWFTFAVNMQDKKFQVIDSLRNPDNAELRLKANQVRAKVITLWNSIQLRLRGARFLPFTTSSRSSSRGTSNSGCKHKPFLSFTLN